MMSYEHGVIKVLNFRRLTGLISYDEELKELFLKLKNAHQDWIDELKNSVEHGTVFRKTTDSHKCELGMWLDNFNSYDDRVSAVLIDLMRNHKHLHDSGGDALMLHKTDAAKALFMVNKDIYDTFNITMGYVDQFISELARVANSLQKLIIYEKNGTIFGIKVDTIEDIVHVEDSQIIHADKEYKVSEFLELQGVLDVEGTLINVIKSLNIPR
jgi:hypothetical protein